jgi:hypothetical protein
MKDQESSDSEGSDSDNEDCQVVIHGRLLDCEPSDQSLELLFTAGNDAVAVVATPRETTPPAQRCGQRKAASQCGQRKAAPQCGQKCTIAWP